MQDARLAMCAASVENGREERQRVEGPGDVRDGGGWLRDRVYGGGKGENKCRG